MAANDRIQEVERLYVEGLTLAEIGTKFGLTRERIRQILRERGIPSESVEQRKYRAAFPTRSTEVEDLFLELRDDRAVADATGLSFSLVRRFVDENIPDPNVLRRKRRPRFEHYSDEEFLECLRTAAKELPSPMPHVAYAEWSRDRMLDDVRSWPGPQGMMLRFGGWRETLNRAGLPANPRFGPQRTFDLEDAVSAMVEAWRETGKPPTVASYSSWRAGREDVPSDPTVRHLIDGWDNLRLAAWPIVHGRPLPDVLSPGPDEADVEDPPSKVSETYRTAPEDSKVAQTDPFERDPQQLERALNAHGVLQNAVARWAEAHDFQTISPAATDPQFDIAYRLPDETLVLVEVKSATPENFEGQLRIGLGQLLRYGEVMRNRGEHVRFAIAAELEVVDDDWLSLFRRLGVTVVAAENLDELPT
jgi:transcriptional regulator with XRE-family HTH domain